MLLKYKKLLHFLSSIGYYSLNGNGIYTLSDHAEVGIMISLQGELLSIAVCDAIDGDHYQPLFFNELEEAIAFVKNIHLALGFAEVKSRSSIQIDLEEDGSFAAKFLALDVVAKGESPQEALTLMPDALNAKLWSDYKRESNLDKWRVSLIKNWFADPETPDEAIIETWIESNEQEDLTQLVVDCGKRFQNVVAAAKKGYWGQNNLEDHGIRLLMPGHSWDEPFKPWLKFKETAYAALAKHGSTAWEWLLYCNEVQYDGKEWAEWVELEIVPENYQAILDTIAKTNFQEQLFKKFSVPIRQSAADLA